MVKIRMVNVGAPAVRNLIFARFLAIPGEILRFKKPVNIRILRGLTTNPILGLRRSLAQPSRLLSYLAIYS